MCELEHFRGAHVGGFVIFSIAVDPRFQSARSAKLLTVAVCLLNRGESGTDPLIWLLVKKQISESSKISKYSCILPQSQNVNFARNMPHNLKICNFLNMFILPGGLNLFVSTDIGAFHLPPTKLVTFSVK